MEMRVKMNRMKLKLKLNATYLKGSNRRQKKSDNINYNKSDQNFASSEVAVFKGLTDSKITLECYRHQVPDYKNTKNILSGNKTNDRKGVCYFLLHFKSFFIVILSSKIKVLK